MGENYLNEQVGNATKRRDRSRLDEETPKLFLRSDIIDVVYDGTPVNGECFIDGEKLLARAADDELRIDLVRCNRSVGKIDGDDAAKLHAELKESVKGTMVRVQISNVSSLSGGADVIIIRE